MRSTVLVVDGDVSTREVLCQGLEAEGFATVEAADGVGGLERFRAENPDLVVLEAALSDGSGIDVCRTIRSESDVPILMLSSKASEIDKIVGLEVGADDYVTKPFSFREVVARVRALRRRSEARVRAEVREKPVERPAAEAMVRVGRVFVDLPGHRLIRDGVQVPVTPKAFQLLAFLLRNAGQVFTREQLVERVWGYDYVGETRTVNVHVCSLRMRIEDDPSEPQYLQTVRGVGYVLRMSEAARDAGRAADVENERAERVVEFHVRSRRLEETRALAEARSAARTAAPDTTVTRSIPASVGFKP